MKNQKDNPKEKSLAKTQLKQNGLKTTYYSCLQKIEKSDKDPGNEKKTKTKQSTLIYSFNEKAKRAALRQTMDISTRRVQCATSDTETSHSFLIFKTPEPKPPTIQIVKVNADPTNENSYKITASNDTNDYMETSSFSPTTQRPQIIATSRLSKDNDASPSQQLQQTDKKD